MVLIIAGCIETPPSLSRDPDEVDDFDQTVQMSGGEVEDGIENHDSTPTPDMDREDEDEGGETAGDEDVGGEETIVDMSVGGEEITEESDAEAGSPGGDQIDDWPELELPLPDVEEERCDGVDNDLDALIDEGVSNPCGGCAPFDDEVGCVGWRANLIQPQILTDGSNVEPERESIAGVVDPQRLITLSASVSSYEEFTIEGARCERYRSPQTWEGARSFGDVELDTPRASLTLVPNPNEPGRYRALGEDEPFTIHLPQDQVNLNWEGWSSPGSPSPQPAIEPGELSLRSPELVQLASDDQLLRVIEAFQRPENLLALHESLSLRWVAEPVGSEAGVPLTLYVGGSQSLSRNGAYQEIRHYLLSASLFDDGRLDFELPGEFRAPGSSIWVYLERAHRANAVQGEHPIRAQVGHRVEQRARAGGGSTGLPAALELLEPTADQPEANTEGLTVRWRLTNSDTPPERLVVSLILYDSTWTEQVACLVDDVSANILTLPGSRLDFWPMGPQSVRQLTLRADTKSLSFSYPDRGLLRRSDSVILRLSDLAQ